MATHLDLCSGIGCVAVASQWAGFKVGAFAEIAPYPSAVLAYQFPGVPNLGDIYTTDFSRFRGCELLSAGIPCQPFSGAGRKRGSQDERYLWPRVREIIEREARPRFLLIENVADFSKMADGLDTVLLDLESISYQPIPFRVPAAGVGAWHRRNRWIIVAADTRSKPDGSRLRNEVQAGRDAPSLRLEGVTDADARVEQRNVLPLAGSRKHPKGLPPGPPTRCPHFGMRTDHWSQWVHQPLVGRGVHGAATWLHRSAYGDFTNTQTQEAFVEWHDTQSEVWARKERIRALGNCCPPQMYFPFCEAIAKELGVPDSRMQNTA